MERATALVAGVFLAGTWACSGLEISISLPRDTVYRGKGQPVAGLVLDASFRNESSVPVAIPRPYLHVAAAPGQGVRAVIRRMLGNGKLSEPVEPVSDRERTFEAKDREPILLAPGEDFRTRLDVGAAYDLIQAGKYRMYIEFAGVKSNRVEFVLLPLRPLDIPLDVLRKSIKEVERGNTSYLEMFYVLPSERSWDQVVLVYRLGRRSGGRFIVRPVARLPRGEMPDMMMSGPGVYGLVYRDRVGRGWRFLKVDLKKDPPEFEYRYFDRKEKPVLRPGPDGSPGAF